MRSKAIWCLVALPESHFCHKIAPWEPKLWSPKPYKNLKHEKKPSMPLNHEKPSLDRLWCRQYVLQETRQVLKTCRFSDHLQLPTLNHGFVCCVARHPFWFSHSFRLLSHWYLRICFKFIRAMWIVAHKIIVLPMDIAGSVTSIEYQKLWRVCTEWCWCKGCDSEHLPSTMKMSKAFWSLGMLTCFSIFFLEFLKHRAARGGAGSFKR